MFMFWNNVRTWIGLLSTTVWRQSAFENVCKSKSLLSTFSRLCVTAQGGEADFKFTEMSTLVWLWPKAVKKKHSTEDTLFSCTRLKFLQFSYHGCFVFLFFAFFCGEKHVYINCEPHIPHTFWTRYLIFGRASDWYGSDVSVCIFHKYHYRYLKLASLTAVFYVYICTTCHNPSFIILAFFIVGTHKKLCLVDSLWTNFILGGLWLRGMPCKLFWSRYSCPNVWVHFDLLLLPIIHKLLCREIFKCLSWLLLSMAHSLWIREQWKLSRMFLIFGTEFTQITIRSPSLMSFYVSNSLFAATPHPFSVHQSFCPFTSQGHCWKHEWCQLASVSALYYKRLRIWLDPW